MGLSIRLGLGTLAALAASTLASLAHAQTWPGGQTGPSLGQLFAIDKTGEPGWIYGAEDLAGDGLGSFKQQEMSIDIRTAYASTDAQRFWARVYVSDAASPGGNIDAYVFIDNDKNAATGGSAAATDIDAKFTSDPSSGGYEFALGVEGNQSISLWEWTGAWTKKNLTPPQATAEAGAILDPIRLNGDVHGYLQGAVDLGQVGLTEACQANLYVRTTGAASVGAGDLEVGQVGPCVPADGNGNGVPDAIEGVAGCTTDAQCPNGGVCLSGKCIFAKACSGADCPTGYVCTNGRCVAQPTGTCTTNAECSGAVCSNGTCVACTPGGAECGAGRVCGPDGLCRSSTSGGGGATGDGGLALGPDDEIQGGACACSAPGGTPSRAAALALLFPLLFAARRSSRRAPR